MANRHEKKFLLNIIIGFILTSCGVTCIIYACFVKAHQQDWIFWSFLSAITVNAGLLFMCSAVVHKVKADLIRRQKQKSRFEKAEID